ncbi:FadR/GntR family transcriptional regulator [Pseudoruegeria sp. HB172150]|uniref:FadR/GntR family transcriptional regulator n=1 Tax=Pseudoruegeria sp. HB172150 TaxID=2721164 RepID=UPI00155530AC|nr:FadR/GntR family transcriptional regulator [Pseudoruegeria sp. HB172150]
MSDLLLNSASQTTARNNHDRVLAALGQAIVSGGHPPGSVLPKDEQLLEQFGVSRTVLREVMKTLAAKGMISAKARVGTTVRPALDWNMFDAHVLHWHLNSSHSEDFYRQLFEMRLSFEPFAARLAAARATREQIAAMQETVADMAAAETAKAFALADLALHRAVLDAADNAFFHSVGALIEAALLAAMRRSSPTERPESQAGVVREHGLIVEALQRGDADAAETCMRAVISFGWARIAELNTRG